MGEGKRVIFRRNDGKEYSYHEDVAVIFEKRGEGKVLRHEEKIVPSADVKKLKKPKKE